MKHKHYWIVIIGLLVGVSLSLLWQNQASRASVSENETYIIGEIADNHTQPVVDARVVLFSTADPETALSEATTQADGRFALPIPESLPQDELFLQIKRAHFAAHKRTLTPEEIRQLHAGETINLPNITLERQITAGFWIATIVFVFVLILIATGVFHNTLAALTGTAILFVVSYLGHPLSETLYIFNFHDAINYIDWNVIFLVMGMMIFIAVIENTGVFQWLSYFAYRISGGRVWLLVPVLMLITGIASAFLDNVTTMLLMTPITLQIAIAIGVNPLAMIMPEVLASNVVGVSTLVGTPTNILIGSYGKLSFNDFLTNLTPGVIVAFIGLIIYSLLLYKKDFAKAKAASPELLAMLAERGKITKPEHLKKAGIIGAGMLLMFIFGEKLHLVPAVTALVSSTALMIWIKPDIEEMIEAVDWTTLVFFMSLFIVVGAIQEVGLISIIADSIGNIVGNSLILTMLSVIWLGAILSVFVANIPFTAAMLPIVGYLTLTVPGAETKVLYYCLSIGAALGGNGSLIGASANMVTAGISNSVGYPISYAYFFKKGFPAMLITVTLATLWLLFHFLV